MARALKREWLEKSDMTIEELVDEANRLLARVAPKQTRYKVTERVDIRTVRYYLAKKLLPKAARYTKSRARYDSEHLLRILMIKRLQAEGSKLKKIKQLIDGMSKDAIVESLFEGGELPSEETMLVEEAPEEANRFHLLGGGVVEVPRYLLENPEARDRLADDLRALARWVITGTQSRRGQGDNS